jgi:Protein of unknown function (DUF3363)
LTAKEAARVTAIDRQLLEEADKERILSPHARDPMLQSLRVGRLQKLKQLGLAEDISKGRLELDPDMESTLRQLGERGDIIVQLHRDLNAHGIDRPPRRPEPRISTRAACDKTGSPCYDLPPKSQPLHGLSQHRRNT